MTKYLVVVESPAKARTIGKMLGSSYIVRASYGHVRDLPKNELGVDVENDFQPKYVTLSESAKAVKEIREAAAKVDRILLASDPDREGEAIGWHIAELLRKLDKPIQRIEFNAITKRNVTAAAQHPRAIDKNLVDAQQARRILDRLVGYKISPLLQWRVRKGLSAGRVQSVAVRMVCDREAEVRAFVPEEYWTIDALLETAKGSTFTGRLFSIDGEKARVANEASARDILARLEGAAFAVSSVERKEVRRYPAPPFITSSLQQEASRKLGFSPRQTDRVAQGLYEGVTLGAEGQTGVITYMRTDSTRVEPEALDEVRSFLAKNFDAPMLPEKPNFYKSKKGAQDAHEAIRPTSAFRTPDSIKEFLDERQLKLYTLIWQRFVASQMTPAVLDQTSVDITARQYLFRAVGTVVKFPGFTKLYEEATEETNGKEAEGSLPELAKGEALDARELKPEQHFTKPPARYSEATLIRALEENGIGRPSTYAPTINRIQEVGYVEREKRQLKPTPLGEEVNVLLMQHFPGILDLRFTADLEEDLDHVEEGRRPWVELLRTFYAGFEAQLRTAQELMVNEVTNGEKAVCPKCGAPMLLREGRFGPFLACEKYPECKTSQRIAKPQAVQETDEVCDQCGEKMIIREGRFGKFLACSTYPKCKNTHNIDKEGNKVAREPKEPPQRTEQPCPKCGAMLLIRKSRTGEAFYGCEKYPKCKFTKPMELGLPCLKPDCGGTLVSRIAGRRRIVGCDRYPECDFAVFGQIDKAVACSACGNNWTYVTKDRGGARRRLCPAPACGHAETIAED